MSGITDTKKIELQKKVENQSTCILIIEHFSSGKNKAREDINQYKDIEPISPAITKDSC